MEGREKEREERERERNEGNDMVWLSFWLWKIGGADQRWDDVGLMQNFSMTIMEAWSSYPTVSNSIWGKGG